MPITKDITLDEATHTYTDQSGQEYTSVSKVIGQYKEPFDREGIAQKVAKRDDIPVEEVLAEWDSAAPYGTAVHKQMEGYFLGTGKDFSLIEKYFDTIQRWRNVEAEFYPEAILCHRELKIAGTADLLVQRNGKWSILDWKTNKAIQRQGYRGKKLKGVLSHLDDCNYVTYSLQLSFYATMLEEPIHKMNLIHIPRNQETIEAIACLDLRKEVELVLADRNKSSQPE